MRYSYYVFLIGISFFITLGITFGLGKLHLLHQTAENIDYLITLMSFLSIGGIAFLIFGGLSFLQERKINIDQSKRPKGIWFLIIVYIFSSIYLFYNSIITELYGNAILEIYPELTKDWFFTLPPDVRIFLLSGQGILFIAISIGMYKRIKLARFAIIGFEIYSIIHFIWELFNPREFIPEDGPIAAIFHSEITDSIFLIFSLVILVYMWKPDVIGYFNSSNRKSSK